MKKTILAFSLSAFIFSCNDNNKTEVKDPKSDVENTNSAEQQSASEEAIPESITRYIKVDHLNVRKSSGTSDRPHKQLMEGDTVEITGNVSDKKFEASFRGKTFNEYWYEVTLKNGSTGWVHGGALMKEPPKLKTYKTAEDFDTPESRKAWWNDLSDNYKKAFNIMITSKGETTSFPGDEGIQKIFKEKYIELSPDAGCGDINFEFKLTDVSGLKNLTNATSINLSYNDIKSIKELRNLKGLKSLTLESNPIKSLEGIGGLKSLSSLDISGTGSPSLNALLSLENLESLRTFHTKAIHRKNH